MLLRHGTQCVILNIAEAIFLKNPPLYPMKFNRNIFSKMSKEQTPIASEETQAQKEAPETTATEHVEEGAEQTPETSDNEVDGASSEGEVMDIAALKKALEESEAHNKRLQADFINFRKRKEKEMADTVVFANQALLKDLLPVLDDFERTLGVIDKSDNLAAIKSGIEGVNRNLHRILTRIGLEVLDTQKGETFDSTIHEAITTVAMGEEFEGKVFDVMEKGYKLRDRIIRFSRVVVGE